MDNIKSFFENQFTDIVGYISVTAGLDLYQSQLLIMFITGYIFSLIVLCFIHSIFLKLNNRQLAAYTLTRDEIIYSVYSKSIENNMTIDLKNSFFVGEKTYFDNAIVIKEKILDIEKSLGQSIISPEQRANLSRKKSRFVYNKLLQKSIGYLISILTLGIYRIFW